MNTVPWKTKQDYVYEVRKSSERKNQGSRGKKWDNVYLCFNPTQPLLFATFDL